MKKRFFGIIVVVMAIVILFTFTGCNKYKWDAVGSLEGASNEAENNGSFAVKQGNYLYFINGVDTNSIAKADDNKWGSAPVKGNIMKAKIKEDGSLDILGIVVPKIYYTQSADSAGITIFGKWIYYVSRTIKTDNKGDVLSGVEFLRTTIDGTKTESIANVEDNLAAFVFTKTGLIYTTENNIYFVGYSDKKIEKAKTVVETYKEVVVNKGVGMFYVKASENLVAADTLGIVTGNGSNVKIIKPDSYYTGSGTYYEDIATQFKLDIVKYDAKEKALYYTKTASDSKAEAGTYAYKFGSDFTFNKDNEVKFANKALTDIYTFGLDKGILDTAAADIMLYKKMTNSDEIVSDKMTASAKISIIFEDGKYTYYLKDSLLYRATLLKEDATFNTSAYEEQISDEKMGTYYGNPVLLGGYVYFEAQDELNYTYRLKLADYKTGEEITMPKAYIVSGYKNYDTKEEYTLSKDDEIIKNKVPAYMTSKDIESYITAHKDAE